MSIIDIHCHPALKIFLFDQRIAERSNPHNLNITRKLFVNVPDMQKGGVQAAVAVHYLPERGLITDINKRLFFRVLIDFAEKECSSFIDSKFEDKSTATAPFLQIMKMIRQFEDEVQGANDDTSHSLRVRIAKSFSELNVAMAEGETVFLHSVEGAHCLGHRVDYATCEKEITELFEAGVCQFTIAHFFENILVSCLSGIPPKVVKLIEYDGNNTYAKGYNEENNLAERVIEKMFDLGIIIDLVHCVPGAKEMVYAVNENRGSNSRPLVFSHTGLREVVQKYSPQMRSEELAYCPDKNDVLRIKKCDGVLGIIFMDYWLNGIEQNKTAIPLVVETMQAIRAITGDYNNISIGTDLDGFTEVPKDLAGEEYMPRLIEEMRIQKISEEDIGKISMKNYLRVLEKGWGKK